jgi:hypothetical protein
MLDFSKANRRRQPSIWVGKKEYPIRTEFCHWLSFEKKLSRSAREPVCYEEFDYLYKPRPSKPRAKEGIMGRVLRFLLKRWWPKEAATPPIVPPDRKAGFDELYRFYLNEQPLPRDAGKRSGVIPFDWKLDSEYIYAAFMQQYGINLMETDLHWHDFLALLNALTGTYFNDIKFARYDESKVGTAGFDRRMAWEIIRGADAAAPAPKMKKPRRNKRA